ncbi:hypothetical protein A5865_003252, partial [Enterococcus sp. 12E11_DIV0728]
MTEPKSSVILFSISSIEIYSSLIVSIL